MPDPKAGVHSILTVEASDRGFERAVNLFLATLIVLNVAAVMLETVEDMRVHYGGALWAFEVFSLAVFGLEYVLRLWRPSSVPIPYTRSRQAAALDDMRQLNVLVHVALPQLADHAPLNSASAVPGVRERS
jgi:hypothetical protein